ncbi:MAG TPA: hypothetical protein VFK06_12945 [Candidatus Angelobacter sp.]|nr:hypothetical protein [Candidatus Angelobacter sp.]
MKTILEILKLAAPLQPGFHLRIENAPWMMLVIEDIQERGPDGFPVISVAHYGELNGDLMRDPEMLFEMSRSGEEAILVPMYYRNDYAGVEQYSAWNEDRRFRINARLQRDQAEFALMWDDNLRHQGFVEAFRRQRMT